MHESAQTLPAGAEPTYERVATVLRAAVHDGRLPRGTVVLEGRIANVFGTSRSPVRQALAQLQDEGLVHRFAGRGVVVGAPGSPLLRGRIDAASLGLRPESTALLRIPAWRRAYDQIERDLIQCSVLGSFRINAVELARHYGISRTVAHQVLMQAATIGILSAGHIGHWAVVPLHQTRLRNLYALREALEPAALQTAAARIPETLLDDMVARLRQAQTAYPGVRPAELDQLEVDLHVSALSYGDNPELLQALARTRCIIVSSKHLLGASGSLPVGDPFLEEHGRIVDALRRREGQAAGQAMVDHLRSAQRKVQERLLAFSAQHTAPQLPFLSPHSGASPL